MASLKRNILFNYAGSVWTGLANIIFIPLYIKFLGIESYGLVGFYASLNAVLFMLDLGLSATISRELARLSVLKDQAQTIRNTVRTFEIIYWTVGLLVAALILLAAPLIASHWLSQSTLSVPVVTDAIRLMGVLFLARWPMALYNGGLNALEQQGASNLINVVTETLKGAVVALLLWLFKISIIDFFIWQAVVSLLATLISAHALWRSLPEYAVGPRFDKSILKRTWRFSASMTAISLVSILLMQADKIILSRALSLEMFGYYAFASAVAANLSRLSRPVYQAYYPRFVQAVAAGDQATLHKKYHQACQIIAVLVVPLSICIAFFSNDILLLWTGNATVSRATSPLLSILIIGSMCNAIMTTPYVVQLAYGWTKLTLYINIASVVLLLPLLFFMIKYYGAIGAAMIWMLLNISYVLFGSQLMYRRILRYEKRKWYTMAVTIPILVSLAVVLAGKYFNAILQIPAPYSYLTIGTVGLASILCLMLLLDEVKRIA